jgi:hypothetical protein
MARVLRDGIGTRGSRPTIGVVAGWQAYERTTPNWFLEAVMRGAAEAGATLGCDVLLSCGVEALIDDPAEVRPGWPVLGDQGDFVPVGPWNTDGLVFVSPLRTAARRGYALSLQQSGFPVVFVGSGDGIPAVVADSGPGSGRRSLPRRLAPAIAYLGDPLTSRGPRGSRLPPAAPWLGLDASEALVAAGLHSEEGGFQAMRTILASGRPFTAVLSSNDTSAIGAIRALAEAGRRVPEDVAIVGFDDQPGASAHVPPLATIGYPLADAGRRAVGLLLDLIRCGHDVPETIAVPTKLIRRRSCGCLHKDANTAGAEASAPAQAAAASAPTAMVRALDRAPSKLPEATVRDRAASSPPHGKRDSRLSRAFEVALGLLQRRVRRTGPTGGTPH